jgi:IMP dehydrogenase/GMP reductase
MATHNWKGIKVEVVKNDKGKDVIIHSASNTDFDSVLSPFYTGLYAAPEIIQELVNLGILYVSDGGNLLITQRASLERAPRTLDFSDVAIFQKKNLCKSRLDADISSEIFRGVTRPVPLIASNMSSVVNADFCIKLFSAGALGVMHRAAPEEYILKEVGKIARECDVVAASIGVGDGQYLLAKKLIKVGTNVIVIDIAHGYSDAVVELGRKLKNSFPSVKVVVGNTININMLEEVNDFADAIKVGLSQGSACSTKNTAGVSMLQFSAVLQFKERATKLGMPIISDGGIKEPADFVKAIAAGASSVMGGRIFAMCPESAAQTVEVSGQLMKLYYGMASRENQNRWRGGLKKGTCPEGKTSFIDIGESLESLLERYSGALRSGITYGGGTDIKSFQKIVEFVRV